MTMAGFSVPAHTCRDLIDRVSEGTPELRVHTETSDRIYLETAEPLSTESEVDMFRSKINLLTQQQ